MDSIPLVAEQIEDGRLLLDAMQRRGIPWLAAAWTKRTDDDRWRLHVASPVADQRAQSGAYLNYFQAIRELGPLWFTDSEVRLVGETNKLTHRLVELLERHRGKEPVRIPNQFLEGIPFDEVLLYPRPLARPQPGHDLGPVRLKREVRPLPDGGGVLDPLSPEDEKDLQRLATAGVPRSQAEVWVRQRGAAGEGPAMIPAGTVVRARVAGWCGERPEDDANPMLLVEAPDGTRGFAHKDDVEPVPAA